MAAKSNTTKNTPSLTMKKGQEWRPWVSKESHPNIRNNLTNGRPAEELSDGNEFNNNQSDQWSAYFHSIEEGATHALSSFMQHVQEDGKSEGGYNP